MKDPSWPILCLLIQRLRELESWTGETHVQKAAFALERLAGLEWDMGFIIYKYGPFSFRLREQLGELRAWGYLEIEYSADGYGARHSLTASGKQLAASASLPSEVLNLVAERLGPLGVKDLEKLATALFWLTEPSCPADGLQEQMKASKPHLTEAEIAAALREAKELLDSRCEAARPLQT